MLPRRPSGLRRPGYPRALALVTVLALALTGSTPPTPAAAGASMYTVTFTGFTADATSITPQPFRTRDGQRRTELVVRFSGLTVRDLCFSLRKPGAGYTQRITIPVLHARDLTLALDSLDGLGVLGRQLSLRALPSVVPLGPPRGRPGFLPVRIGGGLLTLDGTFRWVQADGFHVEHLALHQGPRLPPCR